MAMEEDEVGESGAIKAAVRSAKKASRPAKIGEPERRPGKSRPKAEKKRRAPSKTKARAGGAFEQEMGKRPAREGVRAKKGDGVGGFGKKKPGKKK